jgi:hypothetical protein
LKEVEDVRAKKLFDTSSRIEWDKQRWRKIMERMRLPLFKRVWVVEEAGLAKTCVLHWAVGQMDFAELVSLAIFLDLRSDLHTFLDAGSQTLLITGVFVICHCSCANAHTWRQSKPILLPVDVSGGESKRGVDFLDILILSENLLESTDSRDRVFAFLGSPLARRAEGQLLIDPDYTKTADHVYLEVATALMRRGDRDEWVLYRAQPTSSELEKGRPPFWVPRWHRRLLFNPTASSALFARYDAGGKGQVFESRIQNGCQLCVLANVFDRIVWVSVQIQEKNALLDPSR